MSATLDQRLRAVGIRVRLRDRHRMRLVRYRHGKFGSVTLPCSDPSLPDLPPPAGATAQPLSATSNSASSSPI